MRFLHIGLRVRSACILGLDSEEQRGTSQMLGVRRLKLPDAIKQSPYLLKVYAVPERFSDCSAFPFSLRVVRNLDISFDSPVTIFVGENGSGKSTVLEAIASLCGLPVAGGSKADLASRHEPEATSILAQALRPSFRKRPRDGYFLRAEFNAYFASLLDERKRDPDFWGDPYASYGGRSLHAQSHGESFLAIIQNRFDSGLFLLDEPESALSPQRQLFLLAQMHRMVGTGTSQFILATHSPILMTYPSAQLLSFDDGDIHPVRVEDTSHYQITKDILQNSAAYWRYLGETDSV